MFAKSSTYCCHLKVGILGTDIFKFRSIMTQCDDLHSSQTRQKTSSRNVTFIEQYFHVPKTLLAINISSNINASCNVTYLFFGDDLK